MGKALDIRRPHGRSSAWEWWFGGGERFPTRYRFIEVLSCSSFFVFAGLLAFEIGSGLAEAPLHALWLLPLGGLALLAADFVSGLVHWFADTYFHGDTKFLGPKFLVPFRQHHVDPLAITRHDFVEANCDNCLLALLPIVPSYLWLPIRESLVAALLAAFLLLFALGVLLTSLAHGWAHTATPPMPIAALQRRGWLLSREHHHQHHIAPHKTHYCITGGWLNPLLDRVQFFRRLEWFFDRLGTPRAEHD